MEDKSLEEIEELVKQGDLDAMCELAYRKFKGEGIKDTEKYKNQGWGLLQVLEQVSENNKKISPTEKFIEGAKFVLTRRVKNSDPLRGEDRWLKGWINRVETYKIEN